MSEKIIKNIEIAKPGFANGISTQLAEKQAVWGQNMSLNEAEKEFIIKNAAKAFGKFLDALGCDWRKDPNSANTPTRVAKAYVNDLWKGRYEALSKITAFPADGYNGIVQESLIPLASMCSHHHQAIAGIVNIAYIPSKDGRVVGLSKMNRIVERFGRRGAIQEQLTVAIHNAINKICVDNLGVAVSIQATHNCVSCRGVKHVGAGMQTSEISGAFKDEPAARAEFYENIKIAMMLNKQ